MYSTTYFPTVIPSFTYVKSSRFLTTTTIGSRSLYLLVSWVIAREIYDITCALLLVGALVCLVMQTKLRGLHRRSNPRLLIWQLASTGGGLGHKSANNLSSLHPPGRLQ